MPEAQRATAPTRSTGRLAAGMKNIARIEFFDAVDATIDQIVELPLAGHLLPKMPADVPARQMAVPRFPYHVVALTTDREFES